MEAIFLYSNVGAKITSSILFKNSADLLAINSVLLFRDTLNGRQPSRNSKGVNINNVLIIMRYNFPIIIKSDFAFHYPWRSNASITNIVEYDLMVFNVEININHMEYVYLVHM